MSYNFLLQVKQTLAKSKPLGVAIANQSICASKYFELYAL